MRDSGDAFRAAGAAIAAIGLGDRGYARTFREESRIDFPLLVDEGREAYRIAGLKLASPLHLVRGANFVARARAREAGHRQHRLGQHPFQLGGSFVFGPGNADRFTHVSETFGDNATPAALLVAVKA